MVGMCGWGLFWYKAWFSSLAARHLFECEIWGTDITSSNIFSEQLNLSSGARLGHEAVSRKQGNPFNKLNTYKDYETIFFLWRDQSLCSLIRGLAPNGNFLEENFPFYLPHNFHLSAQQFAQIIEGYIITNAERQTINLGNPLPREPRESRETTLIEQNEKTKDCFVFYDS